MAVQRLSFFVGAVAATLLFGACGRSATTRVESAPARVCNTPGTYQSVSIPSDGEQRFFLLHVPESYVCGQPMPLLVDFHGTTTLETAEEDLLTEESIALAEKEGFILLRPRSRWAIDEGEPLYQWDINTGDLEKNERFARAAVTYVREQYDVDPKRTYALGFSNGTNMTSLFLGRANSPFHGYALLGGGTWGETQIDRARGDERVYLATGHRDYMHEWHRVFLEKWATAGYDRNLIFERAFHGGHELYAWQYEEAWAWLDRGQRPEARRPGPEWERIEVPTTVDLLTVARTPDGLVVAGEEAFLARQAGDGWVVPMAEAPSEQPITDVCFRDDGTGIAVGDNQYAFTTDFGRTWMIEATPMEAFGYHLGNSHFLGALCGERIAAGGYWSAAVLNDRGQSWSGLLVMDSAGISEHVSSIAQTADGAAIFVGENFISRSAASDWGTFTHVDEPSGWVYAVAQAAPGKWWAVGAAGMLRISEDDGWTWRGLTLPNQKEDMFGIDFVDERRGAIVGSSGRLLVTDDGGVSWTEHRTGLDNSLADLLVEQDGSVVVVGEDGFLARWRRALDRN